MLPVDGDQGKIVNEDTLLSITSSSVADVSDAAMTFTGTLSNINAALVTVNYVSNANYSDADTLNTSVDDQGDTGSAPIPCRIQSG